MKKLVIVWLLGMVSIVPWATYHLLFKAESGEIALILFIAFWVFGFWSVVIPLYKLHRVRQMYRRVKSRSDLITFIKNGDTRDVAISTISKDSGIPEFIVGRVYDSVAQRMNNQENGLAKIA